MRVPRWVRLVLLASLLAPFASARAWADTPRIEDLAPTGLHDLEATIKVTKADQPEMEKISRDFGLVYRLVDRLKDVTIQFKAPNLVRIASRNRVGLVVVNGSTVFYRLGMIEKRETDAKVSRRHSLMDIGIVARQQPSGLRSRYLRDDVVNGKPTRVFEITYEGAPARYIVWVDPQAKVVVKREWRDSAGKLRATFLYQDAKEVQPGLWVPTRVEVRNADGALACVSTYGDIKLNQGLDDTLFDVS